MSLSFTCFDIRNAWVCDALVFRIRVLEVLHRLPDIPYGPMWGMRVFLCRRLRALTFAFPGLQFPLFDVYVPCHRRRVGV